ncbi:MAG: hypothetical protein JOZ69_22885 [Myxococcales bacterium]|nr:hypothetical protein [Myxococcales bacterium]
MPVGSLTHARGALSGSQLVRSQLKAAVGVVLLVLAVVLPAQRAAAKPRWIYGYINASVTCKPQDRPRFYLLVTSQVFPYCAHDFPGASIIAEESGQIRQVVQVECGAPGTFAFGYRYVDSFNSPDDANNGLEAARRGSIFQKFATIYVSESRYSSKCQ